MDADSSLSNRIDQLKGHLECVSREIARLEELVALLFVASCGEPLTDEECDAWDIAVRWAYEELDIESLRESLPEYVEPQTDAPIHSGSSAPPSVPPTVERQQRLFAEAEPADGVDESDS